MKNKCVICGKRKGKRFCVALREYICPACCGAERNESVDCPEECEFLKTGQDFSYSKTAEKDENLYMKLSAETIDKFDDYRHVIDGLFRDLHEKLREDQYYRDIDIVWALENRIKAYRYGEDEKEEIKLNRQGVLESTIDGFFKSYEYEQGRLSSLEKQMVASTARTFVLSSKESGLHSRAFIEKLEKMQVEQKEKEGEEGAGTSGNIIMP